MEVIIKTVDSMGGLKLLMLLQVIATIVLDLLVLAFYLMEANWMQNHSG